MVEESSPANLVLQWDSALLHAPETLLFLFLSAGFYTSCTLVQIHLWGLFLRLSVVSQVITVLDTANRKVWFKFFIIICFSKNLILCLCNIKIVIWYKDRCVVGFRVLTGISVVTVSPKVSSIMATTVLLAGLSAVLLLSLAPRFSQCVELLNSTHTGIYLPLH